MSDTSFIDRMEVELKELNIKIESITNFIYGSNPFYDKMSGPDQLLMREQRRHMKSYSSTLGQRITRAKKQYGV